MRGVVEELGALLGGLARCGERVLEQHLLLELRALQLVDIAEAHEHLVLPECLVVQDLDAHPFVLCAEPPLVVAAELADLLTDDAVDIFERERLLELLVGLALDHLAHRLEEQLVRSAVAERIAHVGGRFHRLVGALLRVDAVDGVVAVADDLQRCGLPFGGAAFRSGVYHQHNERHHKREAYER